MDKKNQIIGVLCIICAFILLFKLEGDGYKVANVPAIKVDAVAEEREERDLGIVKNAVPMVDDGEVFLGNDFIRIKFSKNYGAIYSVLLKKYKKTQNGTDLVVFNEGSCCPALGLIIDPSNGEKMAYVSGFSLKSLDDRTVVFGKIDEGGLEVVRSYSIHENDGKDMDAYVISHRTSFMNHSNSAITLRNINLSLGNIPATEGDITGDYLNFGYYDGKSVEFIKLRDFLASKGFFGLGKRDSRDYISEKKNIVWGSIKNQFFTAILTPSTRATGFFTNPVLLDDAALDHQDEGISAEMTFKVGDIAPQSEYKLDLDFYVGPKDFARLDRMCNKQDLVMQFGFFGIISKFLLFMMLGIHSIVPNWGLAIIFLTIVVKLCLWPLTTAQVRASKKMSAIQAPLREIREKYKNNPNKIRNETVKLFKQYRVNPAAGCLPIFVQIPIFFGLYFMLRTSSELRFAHFLWIKDLSISDTITHIGHFPVNILPFIMYFTMALQMRMTPMPSADGSQKIMLKLMPIIFLICCYSFPSGLVLYWTVQNILTIVQQYIVSRRRDMQMEQLLAEGLPVKKTGQSRKKKNFTK